MYFVTDHVTNGSFINTGYFFQGKQFEHHIDL